MQMSFLGAGPELDFSIRAAAGTLGSQLGTLGLDLEKVPLAYYWVNSTLHYLLEQVRIWGSLQLFCLLTV